MPFANPNAKMKIKDPGISFITLVFVLGLTGCAAPPQRSGSQPTSFAKDGKVVTHGRVTQAELQDDLLRFESQFNARVQNANEVLENSSDPSLRYRAALNRLIYGSNSLSIALGPSPESNLLDMVTFIELSRAVLEKHWIPDVFGAAGQALEQAFTASTNQIWGIADTVLNTEQRRILQNVISAWRDKHPDQINVETVRLSAFATESGAKAAGLEQNVGGLFASVEQSTQAVDSAKLFAERALYYAERAPFLLRLQARLGVHEIFNDAEVSLAQVSSPLAHERTIKDLLREFQKTALITQATLGDAQATVQAVRSLMAHLSDNPQAVSSATTTITSLTALLKEWNQLLGSAPYQKGASQLAGIASQVDQQSNRFLAKLAGVGAGLIVLFWTLFIISKLVYHYLLLKWFGSPKLARRDEQKNRAA